MFTIFNSESLWIGHDIDRFHEIRNRLENASIPYKHKTRNRLSGWGGRGGTERGRVGSLGIPTEQMYQYEIIVYRKDLAKAKFCIR